MASIVEKTFDPTKLVSRTIFNGKPNLFTTSDLNRQVEAIKYQMDSIERRLGYSSDATLTASCDGSLLKVTIEGTYLIVNGVKLTSATEGEKTSVTTSASWTSGIYYLVLNLTYKTLEYGCTEDPNCEIVGAKFSDGTSMAAANQQVVDSYSFSLQSSVKESEDSIILAEITAKVSDNLIVTPYFVSNKDTSIGLANTNVIKTLANEDAISIGARYDDVFAKIKAEDDNRRKWDTTGWLGIRGAVMGKVTNGILTIQATPYNSEIQPCTIYRVRSTITSGGVSGYLQNANLMEYNWNPKWFEKVAWHRKGTSLWTKWLPIAAAPITRCILNGTYYSVMTPYGSVGIVVAATAESQGAEYTGVYFGATVWPHIQSTLVDVDTCVGFDHTTGAVKMFTMDDFDNVTEMWTPFAGVHNIDLMTDYQGFIK